MKKILITLAVALLITAGAVGFKNAYSYKLPCANRGIQSAINAGDLDMLFLGSSTFRCNIDMKQVDRACDGRDYDVAYAGNQPVATALEYPQLRDGGSKIGLLVLDLNPMVLYQDVKISDSRVIWDLSWNSKLRLWKLMEQSGETDVSTFYEFFVTSGMDDLITFPLTNRFYGTRYYKGAKTDDVAGSTADALDNEKFDLSGEKLNEAQTDAVRQLIRQCREDGQKMIFLETPHYRRLEEDAGYKKFLGDYKELLSEEGVSYILASDIDFDNSQPQYYEDLTHMSTAGREKYTKALLESGFLTK